MGGSWQGVGTPNTRAENVRGMSVGRARVKGKTGLGLNDLESIIMSKAKGSQVSPFTENNNPSVYEGSTWAHDLLLWTPFSLKKIKIGILRLWWYKGDCNSG